MSTRINILTIIALATVLAAPTGAFAADHYLPCLWHQAASPLTTLPVPYGQIIGDPDTDVHFDGDDEDGRTRFRYQCYRRL